MFLSIYGYFAAYSTVLPIYFVVGVFGNSLLLAAYLNKTKSDRAYAYQIYFTISKIIETILSSVFWFCYKWHAGVERPGHTWFMNNYILMFYAAHIGCPLANGFVVTALLLAVAMTADRLLSLIRPYFYRGINQKNHQKIALISCLLIGLSTSAFEVKRWRVLTVDGNNTNETSLYKVEYDEQYLNLPWIMALGHGRSALRLISLVILFTLSICLVTALQKRLRRVEQMTTSGDRNERERKASERSLILLTVYQSFLMTVSQLPHSAYMIAAFMSPSFNQFYGSLVAPFADLCIELSDTADVFIIIALNKRTRAGVKRVIVKRFTIICKKLNLGPRDEPPNRSASDTSSYHKESVKGPGGRAGVAWKEKGKTK